MGSQFDPAAESTPFKVLILGGCYGGLSAALNLIDLAEGRAARQGNGVLPGHDGQVPVDITIVDERDGFCKQSSTSEQVLLELLLLYPSCFSHASSSMAGVGC